MNADRIAQRTTLWVSAFLAVATALGFVNKWLIADPIVNAVAEERRGRIVADSTIAVKLSEITEVISDDKIKDILDRLDKLEGK